jgi:Prenyltransferase and squalene oxidase repeat
MKKYLIIGVLVTGILAFKKTTGDDKKISAAQISAAINKSLPLLQRSSHDFLENAATCHSCHSQGIGTVALALAKEKGFDVSEVAIKEALDSTCNFWKTNDNMRELYEQNDPVATVMSGNYDLWALSSNQVKATKSIQLLAMDIMRKQTLDGSWMSPGQRPPLEYYSFSATALTLRNIQVYVPAGWQQEVQERIIKARNWLLQTTAQANEEKAFQLLGLSWCDGDKKFIAQQAKKLLALQHADGGWPQLDSLKSDAYATGQSLYALNQSGQLSTDAPAYQKGVAFLLSTQLPDGSWWVKTRSYPFVPYVTSGFPHGDDQFISAAGTNWAVIALALASGKN